MGPSGQTKKGLRAPDPRRPEVKSRIAILRTFGNAGYGALRPKDKKRSEGSRSKASGGEEHQGKINIFFSIDKRPYSPYPIPIGFF
jgi:hypothetical protein